MANYKETFRLYNGTSLYTGQAANLSFRVSPYSGDIAGLTFSETPASSGNYVCTGFTAYHKDAKLFLSGVEQTAFGIKNIGDPEDGFVSTTETSAQTVQGRLDCTNASGLKTDVIGGYTASTSLTLCGIPIVSGVLSKTSFIQTDSIAEKTTDQGVTIDGVLLKDNIYTGHTGRAFLANANILIVDSKRAADIAGYVYNDLDSAVTYAAANASVNSRYNIYVVGHIGSTYSLSQAIPDYVNLYGLGGMVPVAGAFTRSGSVALSSTVENIYFAATDGNHIIVRTKGRNVVWQTIVDSGDGGTISITTSEINNCGLFGNYSDVGDDVTSGGTNKIINSFGNFDVTWQSSDEMYGFTAIVGDTYNY